MNDWMCKRLQWDDRYVPDRGKVLTDDELAQVSSFSRYVDVDGDGIAARTLPGSNAKGAYFVRGSGHTKDAAYTEDSVAYQEVVDRLLVKFETAKRAVPAPEIRRHQGAEIGIVTLGGCHAAVLEAIDRLREQGIIADYMRIKAFPFDVPVKDFLDSHSVNFVVEQNRDAQLRALLTIETGVARDTMIPVLEYSGMPLTSRIVVDAVTKHLEGVPA